jgi:hypothetical protein
LKDLVLFKALAVCASQQERKNTRHCESERWPISIIGPFCVLKRYVLHHLQIGLLFHEISTTHQALTFLLLFIGQ